MQRRLPVPAGPVDVNTCRNPRCVAFGVPPDHYRRGPGWPPAPPGVLRGKVGGKDEQKVFTCHVCYTSSLLKNNRAILEEYHRQHATNLRFAARPGRTPSSGGQAWERYHLYRPDLMVKIIEIYRFAHNWLDDRKTKETPAMRLGLARGRIYEHDLFNA